MTRQDIYDSLARILGQIAPEVDLKTINPNGNLRDQVDLDSLDFLNVLIAVEKELDVQIPEADYRRVATLNTFIAYVEDKKGRATPSP
jgi:acyl carrier protein